MKNEINKAIKFFGLDLPLKNKKQIEKRYKKLAMKYHPDKGGSEEDFKLLGKYKNILIKNYYKLNINYYKRNDEKEILKKKEKQAKNLLELTGYKIKKIKISILQLIDALLMISIYYLFYIRAFLFIGCVFMLLFLLPIIFFKDLGFIIEPNYIFLIENKEAVSFVLKIITIYLIFLIIYSLIYRFIIKKKLMKILQNNKIPDFLKNTVIYYFILLYFSTFSINQIIILTFI